LGAKGCPRQDVVGIGSWPVLVFAVSGLQITQASLWCRPQVMPTYKFSAGPSSTTVIVWSMVKP
jgi:hypothetical protein